MSVRDVDGWLPYIDAYVDGTLDEKESLRLIVAAENSDVLRAEIERVRSFHGALSGMPVSSPGEGFARSWWLSANGPLRPSSDSSSVSAGRSARSPLPGCWLWLSAVRPGRRR